jgi:transglutaminase-like putative cysteine protease
LPPHSEREDWRCWPPPDATREYCDEFGNRVLELRHEKIEREFLFELIIEADEPPTLLAGNPASGGLCLSTNSLPALPGTGIGAFLLPSALCDLSDNIRQVAARFQTAPKTDLCAALCDWSFRALRYEPNISAVETTASQSLRQGAGVCQDFAHLMIALCRACALPARYVSGYAPGEGRMHAWVEALADGQWQAWDPTHNRAARAESVVVATGRDFRDANPHEGTFRGRASAKLEAGCRMTVIEAPEK